VQIDPAGQKFIEIAPIAIVAAPEPMTVLLLGGSLGVVIITAINRPRKQGAYTADVRLLTENRAHIAAACPPTDQRICVAVENDFSNEALRTD